MDDSLPYGKYLPDVYRFAFLMTGSADTAATVLRHTVGQATRGGLNDIRNPLQAKRWLFAEARTLCAHRPPSPSPAEDVPPAPVPDAPVPLPAVPEPGMAAVPDDPPRQLARLFAGLPGAERTALILFYLFLFDPAELAELLGIKAGELGPLLLRGRALLQSQGFRCETLFAALQPAESAAPAADALSDAA